MPLDTHDKVGGGGPGHKDRKLRAGHISTMFTLMFTEARVGIAVQLSV